MGKGQINNVPCRPGCQDQGAKSRPKETCNFPCPAKMGHAQGKVKNPLHEFGKSKGKETLCQAPDRVAIEKM
jgi:hypothetical protein